MAGLIEIRRNGRTVSRVMFSPDVSGFNGIISGYGHVYMVYDRAVECYAERLEHDCGNVRAAYAIGNVGEDIKTVETVGNICRWLLETGADRDAAVLSVGGGIVSDIAGFAASVYKRGISAIYLPTTLLAQVDAAIGGKTGVNLDAYKNIIGTFHQPEYTLISPEVLMTLPERVFTDGLAEMFKTFIIDNGPSGDRVERMLSEVGRIRKCSYGGAVTGSETDAYGEDAMTVRSGCGSGERLNPGSGFGELVAEAASVKAGIVSRDELESGERRKLNLGHTFAHAIEYCYNSACMQDGTDGGYAGADGRLHECHGGGQIRISHGEAVSMGLSLAARLSEAAGVARKGLSERIDRCLDICGLPKRCPYPMEMLEEAMTKDKKAEAGKVHFILIEDVGNVVEKKMYVHDAVGMLK